MVTNLVFGSKSTLLYYSFSDVFFSCLYESFVSTGVLFLCNKHANPSINNIKQELASKMKWNENEMKSISHYILASEYNAYILKIYAYNLFLYLLFFTGNYVTAWDYH